MPKRPRGKIPKKPRGHLVFVNSMSDLFHENLAVEDIRTICTVMRDAPHHCYQVLTKRADRMRELLTGPLRAFASLAHIWWGVSVENRKHGLPRVDELRAIPDANRFLSVEPLLEDLGDLDLSELHWLITGAESGPGARPMDENWVRFIRDQCKRQGVPLFYKQNIENRRKVSLPMLDGRRWMDMPPSMAAYLKNGGHTSDIEWTQKAWNPMVGCSIISPGCHRCYAMAMARRLKGAALRRIADGEHPGRYRYYIDVIGDDGRWNGKVVMVPEALHDPLKWK